MVSPLPRLQLLCAFGNGPLDDPTGWIVDAPGVTPAAGHWTDLTQYIYAADALPITITRGVQHELQTPQAGTMQLQLNDQDDRFKEWNASGPYYGDLIPGKPIKLRAWWNELTAAQADFETVNMLTANQSSLESGSITGWAAGANTTATSSTTVALDGTHSLKLVATGSGDISATTPTGTSGIPVVANTDYAFAASFRSAAVMRQVSISVAWYTSGGALIATATSKNPNTGVAVSAFVSFDDPLDWTPVPLAATSPASAAFATVIVTATGAGSGEIHYVDEIGMWASGVAPAWTLGQTLIGWTAGANTTATPTTAQAQHGVWSMQLQATGSGSVSATTPTGTSGFPVLPAAPFSVMASFRTAVTARSCTVAVSWYDSSGTFISTTTSGSMTDSAAGWTQATETVTAPATATYAAIVVTVAGAAANEIHYIDEIACIHNAGITTWCAGGPYDRFSGYATAWLTVWGDEFSQYAELEAADTLRILNQGAASDSNGLYRHQVLSDNAVAFWPLTDGYGSTAPAEVAGHNLTTAAIGTGDTQYPADSGFTMSNQFGQLGLANLGGAYPYNNSSFGVVGLPSQATGKSVGWKSTATLPSAGTTTWSMEIVIGAAIIGVFTIMSIGAPGANGYANIRVTPTGSNTTYVLTYGAAASTLSVTTAVIVPGTTVVATFNGTAVALYVNGALQGTATAAATQPFGGPVYFGSLNASGTPQPLVEYAALYNVTLSADVVLTHDNLLAGVFPGSSNLTCGQAITQILNGQGLPLAIQQIDPGVLPAIQGSAAIQFTTNALASITQFANTELGVVYVTRGGSVRFAARARLLVGEYATPQTTLSDTTTGPTWQANPNIATDEQDIVNIVGGSIPGVSTWFATDANSVLQYGPTVKTVTLSCVATQQNVAPIIGALVRRLAQPQTRLRQFNVSLLDGLAAQVPAILGLDLYQQVVVNRTATANFTNTGQLEWYHETITPDSWTFKMSSTPYLFS